MRIRVRNLLPVLALPLIVSSCKNPIDAALDYAFEGMFKALDGTVIEVEGDQAVVRVAGGRIPAGTIYMRRLDEGGEVYVAGEQMRDYSISVRDSDGNMSPGVAKIGNGALWIETPRMDYSYNVWDRIEKLPQAKPPTTGGGTGGGGTGGGTSGSTVLLYQKDLEGDEKSSRYYTVTVPSGTKKLTVEMFEENQYGRNLGDLFVSFGSKPTANHHPYIWTAQCGSVESNRAREVCSFSNPTAGTWHILVYGYHAYYGTSLKVTIDK
jgi:hypothetical protein